MRNLSYLDYFTVSGKTIYSGKEKCSLESLREISKLTLDCEILKLKAYTIQTGEAILFALLDNKSQTSDNCLQFISCSSLSVIYTIENTCLRSIDDFLVTSTADMEKVKDLKRRSDGN